VSCNVVLNLIEILFREASEEDGQRPHW
jgi:hypothetical protein